MSPHFLPSGPIHLICQSHGRAQDWVQSNLMEGSNLHLIAAQKLDFQNEGILVQLDELDELDRTSQALIRIQLQPHTNTQKNQFGVMVKVPDS